MGNAQTICDGAGIADVISGATRAFPPGSRAKMHASGTGKAILAAWPEDRLQRFFRDEDLPRHTDHTLSDRAALEDNPLAIAGFRS